MSLSLSLSFELSTVIVLSLVLNCQLGSELNVCAKQSEKFILFFTVKMASIQNVLSRAKDLRSLCTRLTSINLAKNPGQKEFLR